MVAACLVSLAWGACHVKTKIYEYNSPDYLAFNKHTAPIRLTRGYTEQNAWLYFF